MLHMYRAVGEGEAVSERARGGTGGERRVVMWGYVWGIPRVNTDAVDHWRRGMRRDIRGFPGKLFTLFLNNSLFFIKSEMCHIRLILKGKGD